MSSPATVGGQEFRRARRNEAARLLARSRVPKVVPQQLHYFRKHSRREQRLGIVDYVVCRKCGAKLQRLHGGPIPHLSVHGLSRADYQKKWPGAPLICESLQRELSARAEPSTTKKWPIVCGIVRGKTYEQIGGELNPQRFFTTVWAWARKMGFCGKTTRARPAFYDFDEPVTAEAVRTLRNITGLSVPQFAKRTNLITSVIADAIRPRHKGIQPGTSKKIIVWRDDLIRHLLMTAAVPTRGQDRYSGSRILKTFFPDLRLKRALLLRVMRWCRSSASVTLTMNANDLGEQFCAQAMLEVRRQGSHEWLFARFLPWAPDLIGFFQTNLRLLKGEGNLWPLADAAIAQRWDTTPHVLSSAWRLRSTAIPPDEMRRLIGEVQAPQLATIPRNTEKKAASDRTIEKGNFCEQIMQEMRKVKMLSAEGGRTIVEIQIGNPEFALWKLRDALPAEDRESFNSPRRWGPVIGYAELILGKHYGKHPQTVRDWVKAARATKRQHTAP